MPNWCNNKLRVEDCSPELAAYLQAEGLSFEKIKPTPPEMMNDGKGSWYGWRVANWGTKWDIDEKEQREVADMLLSESADFTAEFDTAWSPPLQAIGALSEKFPNDSFVLHYLELGLMFAGVAQIANGIISDTEINQASEDVYRFAEEEFGLSYDELVDMGAQ
jgi:hypothetical protein